MTLYKSLFAICLLACSFSLKAQNSISTNRQLTWPVPAITKADTTSQNEKYFLNPSEIKLIYFRFTLDQLLSGRMGCGVKPVAIAPNPTMVKINNRVVSRIEDLISPFALWCPQCGRP